MLIRSLIPEMPREYALVITTVSVKYWSWNSEGKQAYNIDLQAVMTQSFA